MWWQNYRENWWEDFVGKPWVAIPEPPNSFNCGELVRYTFNHIHGVDSHVILGSATMQRDCVSAMQSPAMYGLRPCTPDETPQEFDVAFLQQGIFKSHVGVAIQTSEGLMVMHCIEGIGVTMDSPTEILGQGWRRLTWYRHKEYTPRA